MRSFSHIPLSSRILLTGLLLLTASCGDLQDPASNSSTAGAIAPEALVPDLIQPSFAPPHDPSQYESTGLQSPADPALPPAHSLPDQLHNPSESSELPDNVPPSQLSPIVTPPPADGIANAPPWQTRESPALKTVTLAWEPPPTGNTSGYKVTITSESMAPLEPFDVGQATQLTVTLLAGNRYSFAVVGYNAAGDSPPATLFSVALP